MDDLLKDGLERLSITADAGMIRRLETYISEIELFNPVYHLVSYEDKDELIIRHILDCAAVCRRPGFRCRLSRHSPFNSHAGIPVFPHRKNEKACGLFEKCCLKM